MSVTWGIVATIKAPAEDILRFAAHHLELGAHRIYIYLDAPNPDARKALKEHPKCRVQLTNDAYWQQRTGKRPAKHQVRQTRNASDAYAKRAEVDWLAHIDVDEFLMPREGTVAEALATLPPGTNAARVRPVEVLAGGDAGPETRYFKAFPLDRAERTAATKRVLPTWGHLLNGGFLSHVAGKLFLRPGLGDVEFRIHNGLLAGQHIAPEAPLPTLDLCHMHAPDWETWQRHYAYRLEKGSYRAELNPAVSADQGGVTMHDLFRGIETEQGTEGLRAFFDEVCHATPALRDRLRAEGLLRRYDLPLNALRARHFPAA